MNAMARLNRGLRVTIAKTITRTIMKAMNAGAYGASIPYEPRRGGVAFGFIAMSWLQRKVARGIVTKAAVVALIRCSPVPVPHRNSFGGAGTRDILLGMRHQLIALIIAGIVVLTFRGVVVDSAAAPPASRPDAPTTQAQETTTSWEKLRGAHERARKLDRGTVNIIGKDGIAVAVGGKNGVTKKYRVDSKTMILVPRPGKPDPGDKVVGRATVFRYQYWKAGDLHIGSQVAVGWDDPERAVFIEI